MASAQPGAGAHPPAPTVPGGDATRLPIPSPRALLLVGALIVIGVVLYMARGSLSPFVVGLALIYILDPAVERLSHIRIGSRQLPRGLAVLLIYLVAVLIIAWGLSLIIGPLVSQITAFLNGLPEFIDSLEVWYEGLALPEFVRSAIDGILAGASDAASGIDVGELVPFARSLAGFAASLFGYLIIPVWAFYLLKDRPLLWQQVFQAVPAAWRRDVWASAGIINHVFGRWLRAQLFLGLVVGVATFVGLEILSVVVDPRFGDFAVLLAVLAGILELLPIIGPIIAMIPTLMIALTMGDPVRAVIAVIILYVIVQQLENNVLVPIIQGDAIALHPSVVILALIVGGSIAGLLGAIFALPITAAARDLYRYFFRRLSADDPDIPDADDPAFLPFRDRLPDANGRMPGDVVVPPPQHGAEFEPRAGASSPDGTQTSPAAPVEAVASGQTAPIAATEPSEPAEERP